MRPEKFARVLNARLRSEHCLKVRGEPLKGFKQGRDVGRRRGCSAMGMGEDGGV